MSNLLASLGSSTNAMRAMERQFSTIQNNVSNANTPGFARINQTVHSLPFDTALGLPGGMDAGPALSERSDFAEQSVWQRNSLFSSSDQKAGTLKQIESYFDIGNSGVPGALSSLFASFSRLAASPSDQVARQDVIDKASNAAAAVRDTAQGLSEAAAANDRNIAATVDRINAIGAKIAARNAAVLNDVRAGSDAALDTDAYSALEELAGLTDFTMVRDARGALNVYLGSQCPLALGGDAFTYKADFSTPAGRIVNASGADLSTAVHAGKLGALIDLKRNTVPGYQADLNSIAATLAGTVNARLAAGVDSAGNPGAPLFSYDPAIGAASFSVAAIAPGEIAAAKTGAPGGNGNALDLASLSEARILNGSSLATAYGALAGRIGKDLSSAGADRDTRESMLAQARSLRSEMSGVSLDEEASLLMQLQQQYQAAGKLVQVLNDLTETVISIIR